MRRTTRLPRRLAALAVLAVLVAALGVVAPTVVDRSSNTAAAATTPTLSVMGPSELTAAQLVSYYKSVVHDPYRGGSLFGGPPVSIDELAGMFIAEGARYNVRGDVAFAQSIIETGWFGFRNSAVQPNDFNYAGIGAFDGADHGYFFPTPQLGVRCQMQLLRNYADSNSSTATIPDPPVLGLCWGSNPVTAEFFYNTFSHKGRAPYWIKPDCSSGCMGNGNWATSPVYSSSVTSIYRQMLAFYGRTISPESIVERYASLDTAARQALGNPLIGSEESIAGGRMRRYQGGTIYWTPDLGAHEVYGAIYSLYALMGGPSSPLGFPVTGEAPSGAGGRSNLFQGGGIWWTPALGAHEAHGGIGAMYQFFGGPSSGLGFPLTNETTTPGGGGRFNDFQGGSIYWSPMTGAHEVHGSIVGLYRFLGGPSSPLGFPLGDERAVPGGRASAFQNGEIYWSPATGAHEVRGGIAFVYGLAGGPGGALGFPTTDETTTPGGAGRFNDFQGGSVFWSPTTGVQALRSGVVDRYRALNGPTGFLGLPITGETRTWFGEGTYTHFQGGSIYWSPSTGAHEVHGAIRNVWSSSGWELGPLGYPVTDEITAPDGVGRYSSFQGGSIYWSPATGAHIVRGAVRDKWASLGWEQGFLGYPVTDDAPTFFGVGRFTRFQGGSVYWTPATGAHEVHGRIRDAWEYLGWELGFLGYPVSDTVATPGGGLRAQFQGATVTWSPSTGYSFS